MYRERNWDPRRADPLPGYAGLCDASRLFKLVRPILVAEISTCIDLTQAHARVNQGPESVRKSSLFTISTHVQARKLQDVHELPNV